MMGWLVYDNYMLGHFSNYLYGYKGTIAWLVSFDVSSIFFQKAGIHISCIGRYRVLYFITRLFLSFFCLCFLP